MNNNECFVFCRGFAIRGQPVILRKKRLSQIYARLSRYFFLPGTVVFLFSRINDVRSNAGRNLPPFSAVRNFIRTVDACGQRIETGRGWNRMCSFSGSWVLNQAGGKPDCFHRQGFPDCKSGIYCPADDGSIEKSKSFRDASGFRGISFPV